METSVEELLDLSDENRIIVEFSAALALALQKPSRARSGRPCRRSASWSRAVLQAS